MTVIAYRDGVLAADTLMCMGDSRVAFSGKIARNGAGDLAGAAGDAVYCQLFLAWFSGGERGDAPEAKREQNSLDRALICRASHIIEVFEDRGRYSIEASYFAVGSGRPEAMGAMHAGATAEGAVRAAIAHDAWCGGEITVLRHTA